MTRCSVKDCVGHYEPQQVTHTTRLDGEIVGFDSVPAEVCDVCGDVLLAVDTLRRIEMLLKARPIPAGSAPVFDYRRAS